MKTQIFIRFSNNIERDLEIGTSIITTDNDRVANGLCVFYGGKDVESTHKKAEMFGKYTADKEDKYYILRGRENTLEKAGSLGTLMFSDNVEILDEGVI